MARIRSIHPGIMSDEAFMTLTVENPIAIPLLLGLWMEADDDGVFEWKPLTLKAKALPAAPIDVVALLTVLCDLNFIRQYAVDAKPYGAIRNFKHWQRPKLPKVKWPKGDGIAAYVGDTSEVFPQSLPSAGEISPQRKEVGGEEVGDSSSLRSEPIQKKREAEIDLDEKAFKSWFSSWPTFTTDDEDKARSAWQALSPVERRTVTANTPGYITTVKASKRDTWHAADKYLSKRLWERVKGRPPPPQTREEYLAAEKRRTERSFQ